MFKKKYKFLTESVLFEETGLPKINSYIIIVVTLIVVLFLVWSNYVIMEETVQLNGELTKSYSDYGVLGKVGTNKVASLQSGSEVYVSIPGVTGRKDLQGRLLQIINEPKYDKSGNVYYDVEIELQLSNSEMKTMDKLLLEGMECRLEVVTGSKSMLQYLLGNLYDTGKSTFNIK